MINGIILVLVLAVLILAVKSTVKHFRGECSCCGGSKGLIKETEKKLSNPIVGKKTISIEGRTCDHCRQSVEKALNAMDGVSARVNLKKKQAAVAYDRTVADTELRRAVEGAGFQVTAIK